MNNSPDPRFQERAAEDTLTDAISPPLDAELAADWRLQQELRGLDTPTLPAGLRRKVLARTRRPRRPSWWMGVAAAIPLALALGLLYQAGQETQSPAVVSKTDMQELQLALAALDRSTRQTTTVTGRRLANSLHWPEVDVRELPYGTTLQHWLPLRPNSET